MSIRRSSGETIELQVERPRGNPDDPIPVAELREKFASCAGNAAVPFPRERAETVADDILAVAAAPRLRERIGGWLSAD
jgi:hypothetical protein